MQQLLLVVLILSGQNNHAWKEPTPALRDILEKTGIFSVQILEKPETMTAESLAKVDVIVSNWNIYGEGGVKEWPDTARDALIGFVRQGKGFVSIHAGSSSFLDWEAYQKLVITTWMEDVTDHGPQHTFHVEFTDNKHPITKDLAPFGIFDELWHKAPVQPGATVLATAFSAKDKGGTDNDEPILMVRDFGKGRSANFLLGHDVKGINYPSFGALFARSTEWAASGFVTLPPADLNPPGSEGSKGKQPNIKTE